MGVALDGDRFGQQTEIGERSCYTPHPRGFSPSRGNFFHRRCIFLGFSTRFTPARWFELKRTHSLRMIPPRIGMPRDERRQTPRVLPQTRGHRYSGSVIAERNGDTRITVLDARHVPGGPGNRGTISGGPKGELHGGSCSGKRLSPHLSVASRD